MCYKGDFNIAVDKNIESHLRATAYKFTLDFNIAVDKNIESHLRATAYKFTLDWI